MRETDWSEAAALDLTAMWNRGTPVANIIETLQLRYHRRYSLSAVTGKACRLGLGRRFARWPEDVTERLKALWTEGKSAAEMADLITAYTGVKHTREAIIGKVARLGLPRRPRGGQRRTNTTTSKVREARAKRGKPSRVEVSPPVNGVTLYQLTDHICKFPVDGAQPPYTYCGNDAVEGFPYCAWHCHVAYGVGSQKDFDRIALQRQVHRHGSVK